MKSHTQENEITEFWKTGPRTPADMQREIAKLQMIIKHCWVHSGYTDFGSKHMTTDERELYNSVCDMDMDELIKAAS